MLTVPVVCAWQARGALVCAREAGLLLRPEQQCALCPGRIGNSVFALLPSGTLMHYSCWTRAQQEGIPLEDGRPTAPGAAFRRWANADDGEAGPLLEDEEDEEGEGWGVFEGGGGALVGRRGAMGSGSTDSLVTATSGMAASSSGVQQQAVGLMQRVNGYFSWGPTTK